MKILFVVTAYYPDGAGSGRSVRNLAEGAQKAGHEVVVVRLSKDGEKSETILNDVKIHALPIRNIYSLSGGKKKTAFKRFVWHFFDIMNPLAAWDMYKILKKEKPDIVNTNVIAGFSTSIYYAVKMRGIPLVHTMRDYYLMCPQNAMFKDGHNCPSVCGKCKPFFYVRRFAARQVDLFLSNSEFVAEHHRKYGFLPRKKPCVVQFNMNGDDTIAKPRSLTTQGPVKFGFIGRITESKGINILLEATQKLQTKDWELRIAGKGKDSYMKHLQSQHNDGRIHFLGFAEPDSFYNDIDILICPSLYGEPLPRVVYESYQAAVPVIVARTGGTPEIVDDEKTGFIYSANNSDELAHLMDKLASTPDLYKQMSENAAEKAKLFTCSRITESFFKHLEMVRPQK